MAEKIHKSIFRLDFPLAYRILDKLGEYLELIIKKTTQKPFKEGRGQVDFMHHSLSCSANIEDAVFSLNLDVKTFNGVIEFQKGCEIDKLGKVPFLSLADELIEKLEQDHSPKYIRIGFRSYIIIEDESLKFIELRDHIWENNKVFGDAVADFFKERRDIGIVFESEAADGNCSRLLLGPYQEKEKTKYFELAGHIKEGFIMDIDIWQERVELPKFKLREFVIENQRIYSDIVKSITSKLKEAIK